MTLSLLLTWGWILPALLLIIFYRWTFRLFGIWIIPEDKVGIVTKSFKLFGANRKLKEGEIFACNGEAGIQADVLKPGVYFGYWIWQYRLDLEPLLEIKKGQIGLVQAEGVKEIPIGRAILNISALPVKIETIKFKYLKYPNIHTSITTIKNRINFCIFLLFEYLLINNPNP